jgi:uncharacterized membrane protein YcfT
MERQRVAWVDYAKGFCIVMVVMMHSTLGVEKAAGEIGWMHHIVDFAKPFRMPDFFMIAGLFLARVVDRDWRDYLDRKVVHFGYFYLLWLTIQFVFKAPDIVAEQGAGGLVSQYALALIDPFGTMWFIYVLPIFFVIVKATRRLPWWSVWLAAAALQILPVNTGWTVIDETASRFVYFYSGYLFAPHIFRYVDWVLANSRTATVGLLAWAAMEAAVVGAGISELPLIGLALGFVGALAVATFAGLLSRSDLMAPLRYCGQNSIVIYLAFFLPMAAARVVLLKTGVITDIGTISLIVTAAGVVFPLLLFLLVRNTPARLLFERPEWARLRPAGRPSLVPAE